MGKASRRRASSPHRATDETRAAPAPYVARPFEGLPAETEWVALREIIPAGTAVVHFASGRAPDGAPHMATMATVLPMAWPGLHRLGGDVLVAAQSGAVSGDASRDLAAALLLAAAADEGSPVVTVPAPTAETPRLQDLLDTTVPFEVTVHEGFQFWVADAELDADGQASLQRANESVVPTERIASAASVYWCRIGARSYVRWVLPGDEDAATDALARLHAAGESQLTDGSRLLGAFRACGLLVPVWEVDAGGVATDYEDAVARLGVRVADAAASTEPLSPGERRARAGLLSRQVTLR